MPELPEVETTRRGIEPHILDQQVDAVVIRHPRLRWPVPTDLPEQLMGKTLRQVGRRGKYLLLQFDHGCLILHLGMSGSLRILPVSSPPQKHDHFDLVFGHQLLRLHDPRRFGAVLWTSGPALQHPLLNALGPEPLSADFTADHLYQCSRQRRIAVKTFIMDAKVVVGVGNIYANEALFASGIHPKRSCGRISHQRYQRLTQHIKAILQQAIAQGGTTLNDFTQADGNPGYFAQELQIYGREGQPCRKCGQAIRNRLIAQRSSYYCSRCQH